MSNVCILDYGSGNVQSVKNALDRLKISNLVSNSIKSIREATHIILPGVGAFEVAMRRIQDTLPIRELQDEVLEYYNCHRWTKFRMDLYKSIL